MTTTARRFTAAALATAALAGGAITLNPSVAHAGGQEGEACSTPVTATVHKVDAAGRPLAGAVIRFTATPAIAQHGRPVALVTDANGVSSAATSITVTTDAKGIAMADGYGTRDDATGACIATVTATEVKAPAGYRLAAPLTFTATGTKQMVDAPIARMVTRTFQLDRDTATTARSAARIAAVDNDNQFRAGEMSWVYRTREGRRTVREAHQLVTVSVPDNATPAQTLTAINAASHLGRVTSTSHLTTMKVNTPVLFAWELGRGATVAQPWGPRGHRVAQTFVAHS